MFTITIKTGNAAFHDDAGGVPDACAKRGEVIRIMCRAIEEISAGKSEGSCVDYNGNTVGSWALE